MRTAVRLPANLGKRCQSCCWAAVSPRVSGPAPAAAARITGPSDTAAPLLV